MAEPGGGEEDDDYMGDLTRFLTPEASIRPQSLSKGKKISSSNNSSIEPSKKKSKALNWQEQRKLDRERKQREEDEKTLANIEARPIPQSNIGFKLLKQMGYTPGTALGKEGSGQAEPVKVDIRRSRAGIGREDPHKEKRKREEMRTVVEKKNEESLMEEFGSRNKSQWRTKRVVVNFNKAKAALDQLENKEVVPVEKNKDEEEDGDTEEEEEVITEEDLLEILMELRDEHRYCLFCGCQYESMEELLSCCPGTDEDDH